MARTETTGGAAVAALLAALAATVPAGARQPQGPGRMMHDPEHMTDMRLFHALFDRRADIVRQVTVRPDGVEALTESRVPAVAAMLQEHVEAMIARVREARPIHRRDPLFRELFAHAAEIVVSYERTATGVRVVESSRDPYVVRLIRAHADVVTAFIANGRSEMMKDHPVPARPGAGEVRP